MANYGSMVPRNRIHIARRQSLCRARRRSLCREIAMRGAIDMLVTEGLRPDLSAELAQASVEVVEAGTPP